MDFISITDKKYASLVNLNAKLIAALSPNSRYFIFNLDGSPEVADLGQHEHVTLISWQPERWQRFDWIEEISFADVAPNYDIKDEYRRISRSIRVALGTKPKYGWMTSKPVFLEEKKHFARVIAQKPFCILHGLQLTTQPVIFLDADAMLWQSPDFPLEGADALFTIRRKEDIAIGYNTIFRQNRPLPFLATNAGVIGFANSEGARRLIYEWMLRLGQIRCLFNEQTALSLALLSAVPDAFSHIGERITMPLLDGSCSQVYLADCNKFNNFYLGGAVAPPENTTIAHYKGYLHGTSMLTKISALVDQRLAEIR